jgi:hypothetical protein
MYRKTGQIAVVACYFFVSRAGLFAFHMRHQNRTEFGSMNLLVRITESHQVHKLINNMFEQNSL